MGAPEKGLPSGSPVYFYTSDIEEVELASVDEHEALRQHLLSRGIDPDEHCDHIDITTWMRENR
jgi:hypothetical protein